MVKNRSVPDQDIYANFTQRSISTWEYLRWIIKQLGAYRFRVILLIIILISTALLNIVSPLLTQIAIDDYIAQGNSEGLKIIIFYMILLGFIVAILGFFQNYISQLIGHYCVKNIRIEIYSKVTRLPFSFFDSSSTGDLISRVLSDTEHLRSFISNGIMDFFTNPVMLVGIVGVMFSWNLYLGLVVLFFLPLLFKIMKTFMEIIMPYHRETRKLNGYLTTAIRDSFDAISEVKIYGQEITMKRKFEGWNKKYFDTMITSNIITAKWRPLIPFVLSTFTLFCVVVCGILYSFNQITLGFIVGTVTYMALVSKPLHQMILMLNGVNYSKSSAERIFFLLKMKTEVEDEPQCVEMKSLQGEIEYRNVSFAYEKSIEILHELNLHIQPGEIVAFVGPSGVGKSTILSLLKKFYKPTTGTILVDGVDIKKISINSLRKNIGTLRQDSFLFEGTIKENLLFGNTEVTPLQIEDAIDAAQIREFIYNLPNQFETRIGERGVKLSGGQARRLCLARVLLTDPKILILDEPTADIDAITDSKIIHAIKAMMNQHTILVIAHRLWTIKNADRIILMKDGRIEAQGTHKTLLDENQFYREFFASQFQKKEEEIMNERDDLSFPAPIGEDKPPHNHERIPSHLQGESLQFHFMESQGNPHHHQQKKEDVN